MLMLPRNLGLLANLTSEGAGRHKAMAGVRVTECREDWYRLEVTDGHRLAIVCGPSNCPAHQESRLKAKLDGAANGAVQGTIPSQEWQRWFRSLPKGGSLGLVLGEHAAQLATVDMRGTAPLLEGRFPNVDLVLPKTVPLARFVVNPDYLASLCALATAIDPEVRRIELLFYGEGKPIGLVARNGAGQTMDAILMPLT